MLALDAAREDEDLYRISECLGALGEVCLRAGRPRAAFELFSNDAALLPAGSRHRLRLQNYLAVALGRMGCGDIAAPLLWEAFFTALPRDPTSSFHSLASLVVISVLTRDEPLYRRVVATRRVHEAALGLSGAASAMPRAFLNIGDAAWADSTADAVESLRSAIAGFGDRYPVEVAWSVEELRRIAGSESAPAPEWSSLQVRGRGLGAPSFVPNPVDAWVLGEPIGDGPPFEGVRRSVNDGLPWTGLAHFFV